MEPTDDTYVPGYLIAKASAIVGARRAAAFIVRRGENDCDTLQLFRMFPPDKENDPTAVEQADALRQYIIPCLMKGQDCVMEVTGSQDAAGATFALIFIARDEAGIRGVTVMVVDCATRYEAERRLTALQRVMRE